MKGLRILAVLLLIAAMVFVMGCERKIVNEAASGDQSLAGCFACHGEDALDGALLQAEGEWRNSLHASGTSVDYTNRGDGADCTMCHDQQGFLDFIGTGEIEPPYSTVSAIHCFTCHAPHARGDMTVRAGGPFTLLDGTVFDHGDANLCANCHHVRTPLASAVPNTETVSISGRFGPHHGPQADILQGTHLFEDFPGYVKVSSTHATGPREACIGCHMGNPQAHDGYNIGGHSFNMRFEAHDGSEYTLVGQCNNELCHGNTETDPPLSTFDTPGTFSDFDGDGEVEGAQSEYDDLADSLGVLLASIRASGNQFKSVTITRRQAGAAWNWVSYQEDRSHGIHNPKYIESILKASIEYLNDNPIVLPSSQVDLIAEKTHQ